MGGVLTLNEAAQVSYRGDKLRRTSALSVSEGPAGGGRAARVSCKWLPERLSSPVQKSP